MSNHRPELAPTGTGERIDAVDILRGLAILMILIENMAIYAGQTWDLQALEHPLDRGLAIGIMFFLQSKSYLLLSFLFGWGVVMQAERAGASGVRFGPLHVRRMLALLLLGLLHGTLLWYGDVLMLYAVIGLLLLPLIRCRPGLLLTIALVFLLLRVLLQLPGPAMEQVRDLYAAGTVWMRWERYPEQVYVWGSWLDVTLRRVQDLSAALSWAGYYLGEMLGMALLGVAAARRRLLQDLDWRLPWARRLVWAALGVGLLANELHVETRLGLQGVPTSWLSSIDTATRVVGGVAFVVLYTALAVLMARHRQRGPAGASLAAVGQMSVSNYLFQSLVCTTIFYGYGLGLYGQTGPVFFLLLSMVLYLIQVRGSQWWLARYRLGPVEWLWRTVTYGRRLPLRRLPAGPGPARVGWAQLRRAGQAALHRQYRNVWPRRLVYGSLAVIVLAAAGVGVWYHAAGSRPDRAGRASSGVQTAATGEGLPAAVHTVVPTPTAALPLPATPAVQPVEYSPGPIAATGDLLALASVFDPAAAVDEIEVLTGPPYLGRYPSSPGGRAAGDYIARRFAAYGLQPAGDVGTFFQSFPIEYVALADEPVLTIDGPGSQDSKTYLPYRDFAPMARQYAGAGAAEGEVVWANACSRQDMQALEMVDRIVFCLGSSPVDAQRNALEYGAAGLLLWTDEAQRSPDFGSVYGEPWVPDPIPTLRIFGQAAQDLLQGSGHTLSETLLGLASFPLPTRARIEVETVGAETCPGAECLGRNVLGVLPGRDPAYAHQVVILGAHYDHLGESPAGTAWVGANDNASGVAVLLEIARAWHEQGYVPRRTVLFAAWDAEEMGLLGARHYVSWPRYPLSETVGMLQLDMVAAGGEILHVDGDETLGARLQAIAGAIGVDTRLTHDGRSDHAPFWQAGVPADLLIWSFDSQDDNVYYHQPLDTVDRVDPDKVDRVGQIAGLALLAMAEGEPDIADLLSVRSAALEDGDLQTFLATSSADQQENDRRWFADLQSLSPDQVRLDAQGIQILGREATANVAIQVVYPAAGQNHSQMIQAVLAARFVYQEGAWSWAGPDLETYEAKGEALVVRAPPGTEDAVRGLGEVAGARYAELARLLDQPPAPGSTLVLLPDAESLRASTALSHPFDPPLWVGPGTVRLVYSPVISTSLQLDEALAQLLLANAGVTQESAPWLWLGLPLALRGEPLPPTTEIEVSLADLRDVLAAGDLDAPAAAWAAVEFMHERIGWAGVGQFISDLGQACHSGHCAGPEGLDMALSGNLGMDAPAFGAAWQADWRRRLDEARAAVDKLLSARVAAVQAGDEAAFLRTVDPAVPYLAAEEAHWFAGLQEQPIEGYALSATPLMFAEDGSVLVLAETAYRLTADQGRSVNLQLVVRLAPHEGGLLWSGVPLENQTGASVRILYESSLQEQAQALLPEAETVYGLLAGRLGIEQPTPLAIKLYSTIDSFGSSIAPAWTGGGSWTAADASVKLLVRPRAAGGVQRTTLATQLGRALLYQSGVRAEWLLKGVSLYLAKGVDGGAAEQAAAAGLDDLLQAVEGGIQVDLAALPADDALEGDEVVRVNALAWDTMRYLVDGWGEQALLDLVRLHGAGDSLDAALRAVTGQGVEEFTAAWADSLARAHARPEWVDIAGAFDAERAMAHVAYLAAPERAGRQAGSPGAAAAAAYIADQFADYGLLPVGDTLSFMQPFVISYTVLLEAPRLSLVDAEGRVLQDLVYRQDMMLPPDVPGWGEIRGELVWVGADARMAGDPVGGSLVGKIVVCQPGPSLEQDLSWATERGAGGLILVGTTAGQKRPLAKQAFPATWSELPAIPVLELTRSGYDKLLEVVGQTEESMRQAPPLLPLGGHAYLRIALDRSEQAETTNVLGFWPGSDPQLGEEVVVLAAHYDHVGDDPSGWICPPDVPAGGDGVDGCELLPARRYPGANDNASGVGVLLEIIRLWRDSGYQPRRSVVFAVWGAQEVGQAGLRFYVDHPPLPDQNVVAMLYMDAVGGGEGYYLLAQGSEEREGLSRFNIRAAEKLLDGRLTISSPPGRDDPAALLRQSQIPTLWLSWRDASQENWPAGTDDEVQPYRLGVSGRLIALTLMTLAR